MKKVLLIGEKLNYSESPKIHNIISKYINYDYTYEKIELKNINYINDFIKNIKNFKDLIGANITTPFKEDVYKCCNIITENSKISKSVNTIKIENNKIKGHNTDGYGLLYDFKRLNYYNNKKNDILIIGLGGTSRSIIPILYKNNYNIFLTNRTFSKIQYIKEYFYKFNIKINIFEINNIKKKDFDIILNATSSGIYNNIPNIDSNLINDKIKIYDLYYNFNKDTPFIIWCKKYGSLYNNDGLGMLVAQAVYSSNFWFNLNLNENDINIILNKFINKN
ncbi:shikimate dehydrogenase [Candidatus Nardonella dryophthoridicola]|uniref:shikimate dehydrogenase (NADP(+)) n=1 Tax=endosymbiont of Rhynchophorus ferrugineus TaxID=1972133 RepID=A0A2Z5T3Z6_9GAMM|nr:shikimate dehydrogenase [Candidatus Nardonella dryophthoridicola]BBA85120.1 shikimate dehydrogenase (NADP(+)) [endosymbiont of Rhynchophorus ferrugineus]